MKSRLIQIINTFKILSVSESQGWDFNIVTDASYLELENVECVPQVSWSFVPSLLQKDLPSCLCDFVQRDTLQWNAGKRTRIGKCCERFKQLRLRPQTAHWDKLSNVKSLHVEFPDKLKHISKICWNVNKILQVASHNRHQIQINTETSRFQTHHSSFQKSQEQSTMHRLLTNVDKAFWKKKWKLTFVHKSRACISIFKLKEYIYFFGR